MKIFDIVSEDVSALNTQPKLGKLPHEEVESVIHQWVNQEDHIELSNGMHVLSGENHGYEDNVALIVDADYKVLDNDDDIVELMQQFTAQEIDPSIVENFADGKKKDKMTGDEMREVLDKKHAWDDGMHNREFINAVRRHNWVLIDNYPLAKLGSVEDPYDRIIDTDDDYAMRNSDLSEPIVIAPDRKSVMDGNHRVHKAREMGKTHLPAYFPMIDENFADGKKKGKSRPGRVKRAGASCNGSVTALRKRAKNSSGEKAKMYHWCANMKSGKKKANEDMENMDHLDADTETAKELIDGEIASGKITNIDEIKQAILQYRLARIIRYPEDARALWKHYLEQNHKALQKA